MLRLVRLFLAGTLGLIAAPAWAETRDEADARVLEEAFEALSAKEYEPAIAKTGEIIARFEAERRANARYGCSAGPGDPPAAVEGATVIPILQLICTAYFLRGYALVDIGRRDEAGPDLEAAAAMDPDNDQFAAELGEWYKTQRQWEKSLEIFTRASQLIDRSLELEIEDKAEVQSIRNARRCRSYRGIAFNHAELRQWDKARAALDKCFAIIPGDEGSQKELSYINEQSARDR